MKTIIYIFTLLFSSITILIPAQSSVVDVGIGFLPDKTKACGKTLLSVDFRYINPVTNDSYIQLRSPVTINLPAGVTVVPGGVRGYNQATGVWQVAPTITTTTSSITIAAGARIGDISDSSRGTNAFLWVEVQVCNAATVNLAANTVEFQKLGAGTIYRNLVADSAAVTVNHTPNPDAPSAICQSMDIGILLDDSGSMDTTERQEIINGVNGLLDDLQAFNSSGNTSTPYRVRIAKFASDGTAYSQLINLTAVTSANRPSFNTALASYATGGNAATDWITGLTNMPTSDLDILFFFTDGTPNRPNEAILAANDPDDFVQNISASYTAANAIKNSGVHIFTIVNDEQFYFNSSMDASPATPFGTYLVKSLLSSEDSQPYTTDFRTQDYFIGSFSAIKNFFNSSGDNICSTTCINPVIISQPSGSNYCLNSSPSSITVSATGTSLSYQWFRNTANSTIGGTAVGTNSSTYTPVITSLGTLYYYVVITSGTCTTTSNIVAVNVNNCIDAVNDTYSPVAAGTTTASVILNDTLNGSAATIGTSAGTVSIRTAINATGATGSWPSGFTLNNNGTITLGSAVTAGTYNLFYTICAQTAGTDCDTAQIIITVVGPSVCYEDPSIMIGYTFPVKHGITLLGRAGATNGGWPMLRSSAYTALESKTKGFVITRNPNPETTIINPVVGMMVFDTDADGGKGCLKINTDGTSAGWKCFNVQGCP